MSEFADDMSVVLAQKRYERIAEIMDLAVKKDAKSVLTYTDMLDRVFLNKYLGIPIFLTLLWVMFQFSFTVSEPFVVLIEKFFESLSVLIEEHISDPYLISFLSSGVIGGLGSVLVFVPPIFALFLALSVLEDSGYMARAAFVMDRLMYRLGLHGRSFIPLMIGFGCNVPAIMAARSMDNEKDRMITILVSPLMSCSARLPVYVLIASAVFGSAQAGTAIFFIYALGIVMVILAAQFFRKTLFKGEQSPFVLELPTYALPDARASVLHMWMRGKMFLRKAGTIIFGTGIIVWFLSVHPWEATAGGQMIAESYIAWMGHALEPVFRPFGWDWMAAVALLFGIVAKEIVVGTFGILLGVDEGTLGESLVANGMFTPLAGLAFMAFVLIYIPCFATLATVARETNSFRWAAFSMVFQMALAFLVSGVIILFGRLMGM